MVYYLYKKPQGRPVSQSESTFHSSEGYFLPQYVFSMLRILELAALKNIALTLKTFWIFIGFEEIMKMFTDLWPNNKHFR